MAVIEIDGLTKRYGSVTAIEDLSIAIEAGEVFGFLGPNGAGKTTTINVLLDFTRPTAGSVRVFGLDSRRASTAIRRRAGLLLEGYGAYPRLTGREHLEHAIATKDADDDSDALLDRMGLGDAADRPAGGYSKGMRQRMAIAMALIGEPELLVFDEPTTGLDPNGARTLREIVEAEAERGTTVFFSSHILEQVEAVADRIGILLDGQLVTVGSIEELRHDIDPATAITVRVSAVTQALLAQVRRVEGVIDVTGREDRIEVRCDGTGETKLEVLTTTAEAGVFEDFSIDHSSLGDVFSAYTEGTQ